jgi:AhpC/TSA family
MLKNFLIISWLAVSCAVTQSQEPEVAVGKPAPDLVLTGLDGNEFKLSDLTSGGKNVALMFSRAHW